jgi:hypothetical protein
MGQVFHHVQRKGNVSVSVRQGERSSISLERKHFRAACFCNPEQIIALIYARQFRAGKPTFQAPEQEARAATYIDDLQRAIWLSFCESLELASPDVVGKLVEQVLGSAANCVLRVKRHIAFSLTHREHPPSKAALCIA